MKRIILKPGEEERILRGHPWVFDNEIAKVFEGQGKAGEKPAALTPGETADVESSGKKYLGRAFVNPNSKISARIYSPSKEGVDKGFFKQRIRRAILRRRDSSGQFPYDLNRESARIVFAEADFLPGLIVDRFTGWPLDAFESIIKPGENPDFEKTLALLGPPSSWLSVQFLCWGMDERREMILQALEEVLSSPLEPGADSAGIACRSMKCPGAPAGIIEKSGARVRELEGLPLRDGLIRGNYPERGIVIFENDLPFLVHLEEGQKTGHFLDQRDNRRLAAAYVKAIANEDLKVLDACCYTGAFGIHAARAGAANVVCVDISGAALETVRKNAFLNNVEARVTTTEANIFDYLRAAQRKKERYDLIILDPPAFAKSKASLDDAIRGYKEINLRAISLLKPGAILATCSCSQAMDESSFKKMITAAAADAEKRLTQLDFRYQALDHPILMGYEESHYLKCGFYKALNL